MVKDKWSDLKALVDLSFDLEMQKFAKLRAEEIKLVAMRDRLGEMNKDALDQFAGVHPSHLLNGDFLWQTWVGQNLEEIGCDIKLSWLQKIATIETVKIATALTRRKGGF